MTGKQYSQKIYLKEKPNFEIAVFEGHCIWNLKVADSNRTGIHLYLGTQLN